MIWLAFECDNACKGKTNILYKVRRCKWITQQADHDFYTTRACESGGANDIWPWHRSALCAVFFPALVTPRPQPKLATAWCLHTHTPACDCFCHLNGHFNYEAMYISNSHLQEVSVRMHHTSAIATAKLRYRYTGKCVPGHSVRTIILPPLTLCGFCPVHF